VKEFLAACLAAIVLAAIAAIVVSSYRSRQTGHLRHFTRGSAIRTRLAIGGQVFVRDEIDGGTW
jgi:hypothetical protein